ncbi:MAG: serine/threonine-protein kinase [Candidatus Eisenbacteria bacterium]
MDTERHQRITDLFHRAAGLPETEREAFLRKECGGDESLVSEVLRLIAHDPGSASPLPLGATPGLVGSMIDKYRLLEVLGAGGMGEVYLAEQTAPIRRKVALKIIKLGMDTKEVIARFESERQALAMMDHLNIAKIHDAGATEQGRPYFVMEHVKGVPITQFCDTNRLSTRERLELFGEVCQAIHHAHQKGIIHRDIKPSNILVSLQNGNPIPKVIDFGVAKATSPIRTGCTVFTAQGQLVGTPEYMSPEQADLTELHVDTTSDVYSLGVLLYELLIGALPFESGALRAAGYDEIRRIIREDEPPKPSSRLSALGDRAVDVANGRKTSVSALARRVRGELDWIIMRAMEKDRSRRYQSASELALDIERYLRDEPVVAGPPRTTYRLMKLIRRHKRAVGSLVAIITALAIGLGVSTTMFFRAESARERAVSEALKVARINTFLQEMLGSVNPAEKGQDVTVRETLDEAARHVEMELADQPEIQAAVRSTIGITYAALGLYDSADSHLVAALATRRSVLGDEHLDVATGLYNLASLRQMQGEYAEAERLFQDAIAMRKKLHKGEHGDIAAGLLGLGSVYSSEGRYSEAEPLLRETLAMQRRLFGEEHSSVAEGLNDLATLLQLQGKYAEAEPLFQQALAMRTKLLGEKHPQVAGTLNDLATLLQEEGKYAEAETLFREALSIRKELFGEEHPEISVSLSNLALVLRLRGKYAEAEPFYREALAMQRKLHGEEHPNMAANLHNLATLLKIQGRYAEAEPLSREAVAMVKKSYGEEHPHTATCLATLAGLLAFRDKDAEAESLYLAALAMRKKALGEEHSAIALNQSDLAAFLMAQGRLEEAESRYREGLAMQEKILGGDHPDVARSLHGLAAVLIRRGETKEAESLLRRCLEIRKEALPEGHVLTAGASNLLGGILVRQGRFEEAETHLVPSCSTLASNTATSVDKKREAFESVIALYEAWEKPAKADEWREKLLQNE